MVLGEHVVEPGDPVACTESDEVVCISKTTDNGTGTIEEEADKHTN